MTPTLPLSCKINANDITFRIVKQKHQKKTVLMKIDGKCAFYEDKYKNAKNLYATLDTWNSSPNRWQETRL